MTSIETQIYQEILNSDGIKGADIAARLGTDKRLVNSTLANSAALKALVYQDDNYRWHIKQENKRPIKPTEPVPDKELCSICNYYLNCLALESSSSVSQFLSSKFSLQYAVLSDLKINSDDSEALELLNKIASNNDFKAYLGYPVKIFTLHNTKGDFRMIAPVFIFPVEYTGGRVDISWTPSINMEIIKAYANGNNESAANELVQLETELGMNKSDTDVDTDELVLRLKSIRQWDWAENIDPYNIPVAEDLSDFDDGIYNRPIIIKADREKYTQGLESELMTLANMPEENYKGTALYSWIKGDFSSDSFDNIKPLLEVLPLNSEQALAVETALRSNLTIVTGPPGTGKSQVVTDLLVNIAWNGKSALFSSKNNKAVDVVEARVNGLSRRPILLRLCNEQYAFRLAEIIEGILSTRPNSANQADMEFYLSEYNKTVSETQKLREKKDEIIKARNTLDEIEKKYCVVRNTVENYFDIIDSQNVGEVGKAANTYTLAYNNAIKENNGLFARLFWSTVGKKRLLVRDEAVLAYNVLARKYSLTMADDTLSLEDVKQIDTDAKEFDKALGIGVEYKEALERFNTYEALESIDKKLLENKVASADVAFKLWDKWLMSKAISLSASERQELANFVALIKLIEKTGDLSNNPEVKKMLKSILKILTSRKMAKNLQCWAVTSLSAKSKIPFTAGLFDYVIIDEASQCDIASILPLLYRAKRAVIIGDPKQLRHISQLSSKQDLLLLQKYDVQPMWSYSETSLYGLAEAKVSADDIVQLKDHFRSCAEIIEFSNEAFYDGSLRTATKYSGLKTPAGEKPGIRWIDIKGKAIRPNGRSAYNSAEVEAVVNELKRLVNSGYEGTIGVTTPFRKQAEEIKSFLERNEPEIFGKLLRNHEFIADTVHKFQGDERDLMLFSVVVSTGAPASATGFLSSTGNLFNVAITRARAVLVIVGDYNYCTQCSVSYLKSFAEYYGDLNSGGTHIPDNPNLPTGREYPRVDNPEQVSDWEKLFYTALFDAGISTIPQYPVEKYRLDLAIIQSNGRKLDIEVDGAMYHSAWNGELCYRDQLRNQRMFELGWDVKRFWVYQLRDELPLCVAQIKKWCENEAID